ncbi:MAG: 3'-5'-exoribonuclease [Trizodia sp. TS-e1964]|nr:MAG: 3'-5'-exoribonuclease [Trizodia sp. TS-e1964]
MTDRRRINGPVAGTSVPLYATQEALQPQRTRAPHELRKIFLKTGLTPSASGSAYLELKPTIPRAPDANSTPPSALKLTCTVHGPRPLPRSATYSPNILLTTHVKFAPFAFQHRRGYTRDSAELDLAVHLETALRGVIIGDRWPKSAADITITVLEGEEDFWVGETENSPEPSQAGSFGILNILAGCITVASAAIADAGIDCVDLVSGGVSALVQADESDSPNDDADFKIILDPAPLEHGGKILAACLVAYASSRNEVTELWIFSTEQTFLGAPPIPYAALMAQAERAAIITRSVLEEAIRETAAQKLGQTVPEHGKISH